jgi:hypothetical protein
MPRRRPLERPWRPKFEVPDDIDPRAVRQSLRKTQEGFAALIGVSLRDGSDLGACALRVGAPPGDRPPPPAGPPGAAGQNEAGCRPPNRLVC